MTYYGDKSLTTCLRLYGPSWVARTAVEYAAFRIIYRASRRRFDYKGRAVTLFDHFGKQRVVTIHDPAQRADQNAEDL